MAGAKVAHGDCEIILRKLLVSLCAGVALGRIASPIPAQIVRAFEVDENVVAFDIIVRNIM